jgi:cell division protein FtsB
MNGDDMEEEDEEVLSLKACNDKIATLSAENTSKGYRISALEGQLESSTKDYAAEIARLRYVCMYVCVYVCMYVSQ